ncbi:hypothetical protein AB4181_14345 [Vibrio lentus]
MDFISVGVGFLGGIFTGAAGTYFGNKYTDVRREKEAKKLEIKLWKELELKFPNIIQEMKDDFGRHGNQEIRKSGSSSLSEKGRWFTVQSQV